MHEEVSISYHLARRRRITIIRRFLMVFIISLGIFTMFWASTVATHRPPRKSQKSTLPPPSHLIIVPGHSIQKCGDLGALQDNKDSCWYLLDYQQGQHRLYIEHIKEAIRLSTADPASVLIFSGGQTRAPVGQLSEAQSYYKAALMLQPDLVRAEVEEYARDSFENLAFSLCRFMVLYGRWPERVTVVGFPFKGPRFTNLHWATINQHMTIVPSFQYIDVYLAGVPQDHLIDDAYPLFEKDPYGDTSEVLRSKREARDPFHRSHPYTCFPFLHK
jgi:hypothetical protein